MMKLSFFAALGVLLVLKMVGSSSSFIDNLPSVEAVQKRVNDRCDELLHVDGNGELSPCVCTICDKFLHKAEENKRITVGQLHDKKGVLSWEHTMNENAPDDVKEYYQWKGDTSLYEPKDDTVIPQNLDFVKDVCLSPRGILYKPAGKGQKLGFSCCRRCKGDLQAGFVPRHAIVNNNWVGVAPECLRVLTEVELAFLSPVKHYGYCFTWTGGKQKLLKGTLTFMRVE
jgi:hypothetical protein